MVRLKNQVYLTELDEPVAVMRMGGIGSCVAGNWQKKFSEVTDYLNENGIKFAYIVDDGAIAEISVNGRENYLRAKSILLRKGLKGVIPDLSPSYFSKK